MAYNQLSGKYESDAYGNICSMKWNTTELEMKYDYDLLVRTTGVTTPDGKTVNYSYDKNGLLTSMEGIIKGSIKYETDKARIESYTLENASGKVLEKTFKYDSLGNISSMEYSAGNKKTGFSYLYDNNYNITTRTALDTGKTSWFSYDKADRLIQSQMHGAFETRDNLANGKLSQIDRDLAEKKDAETFFDTLPQNITLDSSARSFVYDFGNAVSVNRIELFPDSYTHRVRERDIRLYYKESENSDWEEIRKWKFTKDEKNGSLRFAFNEAATARQIKVHCTWDDRNFLNVSIDTKATFKGNPVNLLRIWTLEESRIEDYEYDGNSGRTKLIENGTERLYQYYTNKENGNTARVKYDDKWWYTYDANGNRTVKGYNKNPYSKEVTIDETKEYWTYTWDLWNRLVKVEQHNAPDNAANVCVEYTYDVLNHRIQRESKTKSAAETTQYAYGRNGAVTYQKKKVGDSVTTRSFVYLNNQIVGFTDKEGQIEGKFYTVTDIQGSVTEVYGEDGSLVWKSGYTAFGIKAGETTNLIDFDGLYTGCDYDAETGLTYHWNRWRSEDGDSWLSEDFARDGVNWYGYAGQNPINWQDDTGLSTTRDDFAFQQRTENSPYKNNGYPSSLEGQRDQQIYRDSFRDEEIAAAQNQGFTDVRNVTARLERFGQSEGLSRKVLKILEKYPYMSTMDIIKQYMNFNVIVSVLRPSNGLGDSFDSIRRVYLSDKYGNIVKVYEDLCGANCAEDLNNDDPENYYSLPDGLYYCTTNDLTNEGNGIFSSTSFWNTYILKTNDKQIPSNVRDDINNGHKPFQLHSYNYKNSIESYNKKKTPRSGGCNITKGQYQHNLFMTCLRMSICPENIKYYISSKNISK